MSLIYYILFGIVATIGLFIGFVAYVNSLYGERDEEINEEIESTGRKWKTKPSETFLVRRGNIVSYNPITNEFGNFEDLTESIEIESTPAVTK